MNKLLIAAVAAAAISSTAVQAQGIPQGVANSSRPNPQWTQAERNASAGPVAWLGHLFGGAHTQQTARAADQSQTATATQQD